MMNHIDSKFKQYRHVRIEAKKENGKTRYNYIPTAMIDELEQVYETYPQTIRHAVDSLINKIKRWIWPVRRLFRRYMPYGTTES